MKTWAIEREKVHNLYTYKDDKGVVFRFSSELALVDEVIQLGEEFVRDCGMEDTASITLVLRELLVNAVFHGNRGDASREIRCQLELTEAGQFKIQVEDEGEGFEYATLDTHVPEDPRSLRHRGYVLVRAVSDRLDFNVKGNRVTAYVSVT